MVISNKFVEVLKVVEIKNVEEVSKVVLDKVIISFVYE